MSSRIGAAADRPAIGRYGSPDDLLRDADLALYSAKDAGRDRYALFDPSMSTDAFVSPAG